MSAEVKLEGFAELQQALLNLPEKLKAEAASIVLQAGEDAKTQVQAAYPQGPTGNLRRGVTVRAESSRFGVASRVKSNAKHVHIYEDGTVQRRTKLGANRGVMPRADEAHRMIPIVIRVRRQMVQRLIDLVQREGLVVTSS